MFPGPGKGKSRSDMPRKAKDQCADTGTCKVDGASKMSAKAKQKERLKKMKDDDIEDQKRKGKVVPKFKTNAEYRDGGKIHKNKFSRNTRGAEGEGWKNR